MKMIGTINGYVLSKARFGRREFTFDGTTLGLVRSAISLGAKVGDVVTADFGGGYKPLTLYANPRDERCGGVWAR